MSVAPMPTPGRLPTGNELMSGPIFDGGATRQEKEIHFVMNNIEGRIESLHNDEKYQTYKAFLFSIVVASALGGVTLVLFGLHKTFFFEKYNNQPISIPALVFGGLLMCPVFYWAYYLFIPSKAEKRFRKRIAIDRVDRRKPTLFNQLVEEARAFTEPPPRKIRILAHIRKHDYPIIASTMEEFTNAIANQCGMAVERQLLRYKDQDLEIHLDKKLDEYYKMDDNDRVFVYNRGGFFTNTSPLKKARPPDILHMMEEGESKNGRPDTAGGRTSATAGNKPSFNQGKVSKSNMKGTKSMMSDGESKENGAGANVSWKS